MLAVLALSLACQTAGSLDFPPVKAYQHSCKIYESYDEIKDSTAFAIDVGEVYSSGDHTIEFSVVIWWDGKERGPFNQSDRVRFHLVSRSKEWELLEYHAFHMLCEGERFSDLEVSHNGKVHGSGSGVTEQFFIKVPMDTLQRIVRSGDVKAEIGGCKLSFTRQQMLGLTDFAARLGVDGKAAREIAAKQAQSAAEKSKAIRSEWDKVLAEAKKAAQKLPVKKPHLRRRAYEKAIQEGIVSVCEQFGITVEQLKSQVGEADD